MDIFIRMNMQMNIMLMMNIQVNIIIRIYIQVNIIPVIGKSDCCTKKEIGQFKAKILR